MPENASEPAIFSVLDITKAVTVLDACLPTAKRAGPGPNVVLDSHVLPQHIAAPTIVITRDPEHRNPLLDEIRQRCEHAKRRSRDNGPPLEPELEKVAVDGDGSRVSG